MTDDQLFTALRAVLVAAVDPGVTVVQNYQGTTQGRPDGPTLLMSVVTYRRYGWTRRADDATGTHVERQAMETTVQVTALDDGGAAGDLAHEAADALQSDVGVGALTAAGCAPLRVTDVRAPFMTNDQDRFEASPSFDVTLLHERVRSYDVASATPAPRLEHLP